MQLNLALKLSHLSEILVSGRFHTTQSYFVQENMYKGLFLLTPTARVILES